MILLIDIGNTNISTGIARGGELDRTRRAATHRTQTADELELLLAGLLGLDGVTLDDVSAVVAASVVPSVSAALAVVAGRRDLGLLEATAGTLPIAIRVDRPAEVGPDRLVNALAAARLHGAPAIVVDFGTATTFDVIAADGAYIGGAIAPGLELGLEALAARTAKLPRVELRAPDRAIGRDTASAMQSGTIFGYQALAAGLLARLRAELADASGIEATDVRTILTGGLSAAPWAAGIDGVDAIDPDLTLRGLLLFHEATTGGEAADDETADDEARSR